MNEKNGFSVRLHNRARTCSSLVPSGPKLRFELKTITNGFFVAEYGNSFVDIRNRLSYPLSQNEHAAIARHISDLRKQLQEVSDLFSSRYGKESSIAELGVKALVSITLLEHELTLSVSGPVPTEEAESKSLGRSAH